MKRRNDYMLIGMLQELSLPYALLYVDTSDMGLHLFVRNSREDAMSFDTMGVSIGEVREYLDGRLSLAGIWNSRPHRKARIEDGEIFESEAERRGENADGILRLNYFNPEFCDDDVWIKTVLKRIERKQPLEIA